MVSTTSFITEPLPTLKSSDQKVDHDATSGFRLYQTNNHDDLYPKFISPILSLYPRKRERYQFRRRRQRVFFAPISKMRFIKCKLDTQSNTCCNFLSQPNGSGINKIAGLNEIIQTDGRCTQMYRAIIVSFHDCPPSDQSDYHLFPLKNDFNLSTG